MGEGPSNRVHSTYATAWAAVGREIPCVLTAMADEFGGPVPCGGFAPIGASPRAALKAAVMCEDVARTVFLAHQLGDVRPLAQEDIDRLYDRYTTVYGQR